MSVNNGSSIYNSNNQELTPSDVERIVDTKLSENTIIKVVRRNTDVNDAAARQQFRIIEYTNSSQNLPTNAFYHVYTSTGADAYYSVQIAIGMTTNRIFYRRKAIVGDVPTWLNWTEITTKLNLDSIMTDDNGDQMTETPPKQYYVTGKFYFVAGKVCRCTAYSATSATFDVYGVVEALNYVLSQT